MQQLVLIHDYTSDVLIIQTAIQSSSTANTVVVGEDTDLLILLLHHANMDSKELYFGPEPKQNAKKVRLWNINEFTKISEVFMQESANKDDIISAGEKALVLLYNGDSGDDLDALRYKRFQEKVVKSFNMLMPKIYHHQHQPSSIASGYTTRFKSGGEKLDI